MLVLAALVAAVLVAYNTVTNLVAGWDRAYVTRNVVVGVVLVATARAAGVDVDALGLAPDDLGSGWQWGRLAVLTVAVGVAAAAALAARIPALAAVFDDRRADLPPSQLAWHVLVRIPVGTAAFEEVAFRGVLLGMLLEAVSTPVAVVGSSVAFGLWHIGPTIAALRINERPSHHAREVVVAVVATTIGGVLFALLRLGSGSVLAPFLAHWAINGLGLLVAAVMQRTGGP